MLQLTALNQITELANELNRKVSKNDLNERFNNLQWFADKQGRLQTLKIGEDFYRTDSAAFYPNGEKPVASGKKLTEPRTTNEAEKLQKAVETISKIAEKYGVKLGLLTQTIERINKAIETERENEEIERQIKLTERKNALLAEAERLRQMAAAL